MVRRFFSFQTVIYLIYAVTLTSVLLYIRFPSEKFKQFCEKRIELFLLDSICSIGSIDYHFPFSLIVTNFQISHEVDGRHSKIHVPRFSISPSFTRIFRQFEISGEMYTGKFVLELDINPIEKSFQINDLLFKDLNIDEWANDFNLLGRKVTGKVNFSGSFLGRFDSPLDATGKGELVVANGSIEFLQPVLSVSSFEFERLFVNVTCEKRVLGFVGGEVMGTEISADFTGEMTVTQPLLDSNILFSGHLIPKEEFLAAHPAEQKIVNQLLQRYKMSNLPFKVGGSVQRPTFRFSI